jgi:hypothetical protein
MIVLTVRLALHINYVEQCYNSIHKSFVYCAHVAAVTRSRCHYWHGEREYSELVGALLFVYCSTTSSPYAQLHTYIHTSTAT